MDMVVHGHELMKEERSKAFLFSKKFLSFVLIERNREAASPPSTKRDERDLSENGKKFQEGIVHASPVPEVTIWKLMVARSHQVRGTESPSATELLLLD
ncbi:hypothetical protein JCGZ_26671 [Jatropha curcas]|uniref:Uncharacterized protein n=1 Tax=Jatropha curcas TaxID=180498 RepID=A0A067L7C8_JATCU|nr:hypothetical protein JCGZ_26671 [Jatropha curcas]